MRLGVGMDRAAGRFLCCGLFAVVTLAASAAGQDEPAAKTEPGAPPEGAVKADVASVSLDPGPVRRGEGTVVPLVLAPVNEARKRVVPLAVSVGAGIKEAPVEAARAMREIEPLFGASEEHYRAWARRELATRPRTSRSGVLEVSELASRLELACVREVVAGEPIVLHAKSVGDTDTEWDVCLVYPDGSRYERTRLSIGKKLEGTEKGRVDVVRFRTFPADGGTLLGVRVECPERTDDGWTFWVEVRRP